MNLDQVRESRRNQFPSGEFFHAMIDWYNDLEKAEQKDYLMQFEYPKGQTFLDENQNVAHGKFNEFCWYAYDNHLVEVEILGQYELDIFTRWESMPNFKKCTVCNVEFDYRPMRELRHQQERCNDHLIKNQNDVTDETELGDLSTELQKEYWGKIVDQTVSELEKVGIVKQV